MKLPARLTLKSLVSFLCFVTFFQAVGGLMGWLTQAGMDGWYEDLKKWPLNPPDYVFGLVWSPLYFALSVSAWLLWRTKDSQDRGVTLGLFAIHMVLNWLWTPVFFNLHATGMSLLLILVLVFTAAMTAWMAWGVNRAAAVVFAPYIGWLIFAGHLTHYIWRHN